MTNERNGAHPGGRSDAPSTADHPRSLSSGTAREPASAASAPGRRSVLGIAGATLAGGGLLAACSNGSGGSEAAGTATGAAAGRGSDVVLGGAADLPEVTWDMTTSWPAGLESLFGSEASGVGATGFARDVAQLTGGRFVLQPRQADEIAGATEVVDVVQSGVVPAGHTASYYYIGRSPAFAFGTTVPFGLTTRQQYAWLYHYRDDDGRSGLDVMRQFYADELGLIQFPCGNSGAQMGGFFNREIGSLADLQGLVMRIPGLGGEIMSRLGVTVQNLPAGEIAQALQTGTVDAAEFVGPYDDNVLGLGQAARFYYYPGWWEPGATFEVMVSLQEYEALPPEYQVALEIAGELQYQRVMGFYDARQPFSLREIREQGAETRPFPDDVMSTARDEAEALLDELASQDAAFATILEHWRPYRDAVQEWHGLAERATLDAMTGAQAAANG